MTLLLLWLALSAPAAEVGDPSPVQTLIDAAADGDTIDVPPGVYRGSVRIAKRNNLTLKGRPGSVWLVSPDNMEDVLVIQESSGIRLEGLGLLHDVPGHCTGDVVSVEDSQNIAIHGCDLGGSGVYGVNAVRTRGLKLTGSHVHDCTYGMMLLVESSDVHVEGNVFRKNAESNSYEGIAIVDSTGVVITHNSFLDNDSVGVHLVRSTDAPPLGATITENAFLRHHEASMHRSGILFDEAARDAKYNAPGTEGLTVAGNCFDRPPGLEVDASNLVDPKLKMIDSGQVFDACKGKGSPEVRWQDWSRDEQEVDALPRNDAGPRAARPFLSLVEKGPVACSWRTWHPDGRLTYSSPEGGTYDTAWAPRDSGFEQVNPSPIANAGHIWGVCDHPVLADVGDGTAIFCTDQRLACNVTLSKHQTVQVLDGGGGLATVKQVMDALQTWSSIRETFPVFYGGAANNPRTATEVLYRTAADGEDKRAQAEKMAKTLKAALGVKAVKVKEWANGPYPVVVVVGAIVAPVEIPDGFTVKSASLFITVNQRPEGAWNGRYSGQDRAFLFEDVAGSPVKLGQRVQILPEDGGSPLQFEVVKVGDRSGDTELVPAGDNADFAADRLSGVVLTPNTPGARVVKSIDMARRPQGEADHKFERGVDLNGDGVPEYAVFTHYCRVEAAPYPMDAAGRKAWGKEHGPADWDYSCSNVYLWREGTWVKEARITPM